MNKLSIVLLSFCFLPRPLRAAECQCPAQTTKEQMDAATYVFRGDIWDVEVDRATQKKVITVDVDDIFKGKPPDARVEMGDNEDGKECAIDFHEGETYMMYVHWQWGAMLTSRCWGTKKIQEASGDAGTLGAGSTEKDQFYEKMKVSCMGRRDTPCCLSSLKAMREGRFLPQPEDGCPDETIPDRLRCEGSYIWCVPTLEPHRHNQP